METSGYHPNNEGWQTTSPCNIILAYLTPPSGYKSFGTSYLSRSSCRFSTCGNHDRHPDTLLPLQPYPTILGVTFDPTFLLTDTSKTTCPTHANALKSWKSLQGPTGVSKKRPWSWPTKSWSSRSTTTQPWSVPNRVPSQKPKTTDHSER